MVGICGRVRTGEAPSSIGPMLDRLRHYAWYAEDRHEAPGVGLGCLTFSAADVGLFRAGDSGDVAVITGEIYDAKAQQRQLTARGAVFTDNSHAEILYLGWQRDGAAFLRGLNGKFAAAIWDASHKRLTLIGDRFGMRPIYFAEIGGGLAFATEIKGLLAAGVPCRADDAAIAQFYAFNQYTGDATPVAGVRRLEAGCLASFDVTTRRLSVERYWDAKYLAVAAPENPVAALERIDGAFANAVRRCSDDTDGLGIALSGGLDSRSILGLVRAEQPVTCVTVGLPGAMDLWVAERLARIMQRPHHRSVLGPEFFRDYPRILEQMVQFTEGQIPTTGITIPSLALYRDLGVKVVLRGHGGELMHMARAYKFSLGADAHAVDGLPSLAWWINAHVATGRAATPAMEFLARRIRALVEPVTRNQVERWVADMAGIDPVAHSFWLLFAKHHLPYSVAPSIVKFNSVVETRTPYVDADLFAALMAAPPQLKLGDRIQTYILERRAPQLLSAPNTNTGVPMGAPPEVVKIAHFAVKVLSKLGVPGFQPYERLGLWLRREFHRQVETTLLSDRCLDRGIFDRAGVRKIIDEHRSREKNHTTLLMAMLCFETAQHELMDDSMPSAMPTAATRAPRANPAALMLQPQ